MRQLIAPAALALILVTLLSVPATAQVIKVSPMSFDFGDMKQQQTETTKVTVTNEGAGLLQIQNVDADCGCTIPTLNKYSLAPGESTDIVIEFSSKKFSGQIRKVVHIETNDPLNPIVDVMITAMVHTPLIIDPVSQRLGFSQSLQGETVSRRATLTATGDEPLVISAGKTRKDLFEIEVINNLDGNPQMAAIEVTVPATMAPGRQRDNVRVTTNIAEFPTLDLEMQAWVVQELTASPARVTYRFKKSFQQSLRIAPFRKGTEFKVTGVECDLPEIKIEFLETIVNEETKILIKGQPIAKTDERAIKANGRMAGTIRVHTNLEHTPVLEIPVTYMIRM
jgi:hypothetical protein